MTIQAETQSASTSYFSPLSVDEALNLARTHAGNCEFIAGGTDTELQRRLGLHKRLNVIDLTRVRELKTVEFSGKALAIGALVTLHELTVAPDIVRNYPLIGRAAASVATPVVRKTATVGGNLLVNNRCTFYNQSGFWRQSVGPCLRDVGETCLVTGVHNGKCFSRNVSDLAPALIALNASVVIRNVHGQRTLPLDALYAQDGLHPINDFDDQSLLVGIRLPEQMARTGYRKLRLRNSLDFTSLTAAASAGNDGNFRICLNGIAMAPVLVSGRMTDTSLDSVRHQLRLKAKVVDNDLLSLDYRRQMMDIYVEELWSELTTSEHPR